MDNPNPTGAVRKFSFSSKLDETSFNDSAKRPKFDDSFNSSLNRSTVDSAPGSPWEWRKMKGDLIALRTRLSHQEAASEQQRKVRQELEEMFSKEKKVLHIELKEKEHLIKQLELRINIGKKTVQEAKAAQIKAERDLTETKIKMEHKIMELTNQNLKLAEELQNIKLTKQEVKLERSNTLKVAEDNATDLNEELEIAHKRILQLEAKVKELMPYQEKFEVQSVEVQSLKSKITNIEVEKFMLDESKSFVARAARATELEKELQNANRIILSLKESVRGKLLLEEQMSLLEHKVKHTENLEKQVLELEVIRAELIAKLEEYESIGISGGPVAIKREISRLQHAEVLLTHEEGQLRSKVDSIQKELLNSQQKHEETKKMLSDITTSHERLTKFIGRLQKKLSLVSRERDSCKQQLDMYEKEMTSGYQNNETPNIINERIPALERAIEGYRELVAKLESDLEAVDGVNQKEKMQELKEEIDRLKGELEHRALKGDFNINTKILHFKMNPAAMAEIEAEEKQKALLQELEQLRAVVSTGNHSGTPVVSSLQAQEIAELQKKHEIKISRLKEAFKVSSHEYRQACYQLFGWRVDRTKEGQYKLSSQYAESPDDYLFFIVNEEGVNMIETQFSATLTAFIDRYLKRQHSVPMFLNAVQSDLFDQVTVVND